ncbi:MAG TPA: hypothetical protein VGQ31_00350 [Candidatus Limnocylindrales bacterium]|jgi:hypothetical protein|nr:hypothetical protein [Candidatus Limnocylindrales bacterium]
MDDRTVSTGLIRTLQDPADAVLASAASAGDWQIEDLIPARVASGHSSRWILALVGLMGGLIGLGFAGHLSTAPGTAGTSPLGGSAIAALAPSSPQQVSGLTLVRPADGEAVVGGSIEVRGSTDRPLGRLHIAAIVAGAAIGGIDLDVPAAGRIVETLPVIGPPWSMPVDVIVTGELGAGATTVLAHRSVVVGPDSSAIVLGLSARRADDRLILSVVGAAPPGLSSLEVRLLDMGGSLLAEARPTLGDAEAWGGILLSSVPYQAHLDARPVPSGTRLRLTITWVDPRSGSAVTVSRLLTAPAPAIADHPG